MVLRGRAAGRDDRDVAVGPVRIGRGLPLALIAGPCVIESEELCREIALTLGKLDEAGISIVGIDDCTGS